MILLAILLLFMPLCLSWHQGTQHERQTAEAAPVIAPLAWLRREFVDPSAPDIVLMSAMISTHARITRGRKMWEVGGIGEPVQTYQLKFSQPIRLRNGQMAYSTDDLLARDRKE